MIDPNPKIIKHPRLRKDSRNYKLAQLQKNSSLYRVRVLPRRPGCVFQSAALLAQAPPTQQNGGKFEHQTPKTNENYSYLKLKFLDRGHVQSLNDNIQSLSVAQTALYDLASLITQLGQPQLLPCARAHTHTPALAARDARRLCCLSVCSSYLVARAKISLFSQPRHQSGQLFVIPSMNIMTFRLSVHTCY